MHLKKWKNLVNNKIVVGLVALLLLPLSLKADPLAEIYNVHRIDAGLVSAGQVTVEQIDDLKEAGIGLVINLAVADQERNSEEGFKVTEAGITYTQIPVAWDKPTFADLELFFAVMDARADRATLVHCFANFRASAFTYLYRVTRAGVPEAEARKDLAVIWTDKAWEEYPQWRRFVDEALTRYQ